MKKLIKIGKGIALFMAFFLISQLSVTFISVAFGFSKALHKPINNLTTCLLVIAILANIWLILHIARKCGFKFYFDFFNIKTIKIILLALFCMFIVAILGNMLSHGNTTENDKILQEMNRVMPKIVMFFMAVVNAPVMEEITFRGIIMEKLLKNFPWLSLILSSLLFGLAHSPSDLGSWVSYGGMGLILSLVYMRTKRLEVNICVHFLWNLFAAIIIF
jgi:membrane protease YdiL (CAAX protease family)